MILLIIAERQRTGIRYQRRQFDQGVEVLKIIKLNYRTGSGLPAPTHKMDLRLRGGYNNHSIMEYKTATRCNLKLRLELCIIR